MVKNIKIPIKGKNTVIIIDLFKDRNSYINHIPSEHEYFNESKQNFTVSELLKLQNRYEYALLHNQKNKDYPVWIEHIKDCIDNIEMIYKNEDVQNPEYIYLRLSLKKKTLLQKLLK